MVKEIVEQPLVSVCVPSYNHESYVKKTLESIFLQTYQNVQLIVIDDGSKDDSVKIIEKTLQDCPFECKFVARSNKGLVNTLNEALEASSGEFFAGLASDDLWMPNLLKRRVSQLQNNPNAVLAYGNCFTIDENNKVIGCSTDWEGYGTKNARDCMLEIFYPQAPTVVFRKSVLEIEKWSYAFPEDVDIYLRICSLGDFDFDSEINAVYRIHQHNSVRNVEGLFNGMIEIYRLNINRLHLTEKELKAIETKLNSMRAERHLHSGQRLEAIKQAWKYLHHKTSTKTKLSLMTRLLLPEAVWQARVKSIKRTSDKWLNSDIEDLIKEQSVTNIPYQV